MTRTGRGICVWTLSWVVCWALGCEVALGQSIEASAPPTTLEAALHTMSDAAGVIFLGRVIGVRRLNGVVGASGVVAVTFQVESAVRGSSSGGTYVLREWAGLWSGGDDRYRVGQRLLMLLRTPNAAGLSSPVGGLDGAIPVRGADSIATASAALGRDSVVAASLVAPVSMPMSIVDLRWVNAQVSRNVSYAGNEVSGATVGVSADPNSSTAQGTSVASVVALLGSWEAARALH